MGLVAWKLADEFGFMLWAGHLAKFTLQEYPSIRIKQAGYICLKMYQIIKCKPNFVRVSSLRKIQCCVLRLMLSPVKQGLRNDIPCPCRPSPL